MKFTRHFIQRHPKSSIVIYLVFFVFFVCCCYYFHNISLKSKKATHGKIIRHPRKVVFILGQGRTGSSLLGELFNERDDFIYLFEPLRSVELNTSIIKFKTKDHIKQKIYKNEVENFLKAIINCRYEKWHDRYLALFGSFRYHSKKLINPPFCNLTNHKCEILNSSLMNKLCRDRKLNIIVKELSFRIPDIGVEFLRKMSIKEQVKLHVIHLVRDPRAYLNSIKRLEWFNETHQNLAKREDFFIMERCYETMKNIDMGAMINSGFFPHDKWIKYAILRYEDINKNITNLGKRLSLFLDLNITKSTVLYFTKKTTTYATKNTMESYSTSARNINYIITKWRRHIDFAFANKVQYACNKVMRLLGYKSVATAKDLHHFRVNLIESFPMRYMDIL